jgi:hypothetical protein
VTAPAPVATPADDDLHAFDSGDHWAVETVWFAFTVPDRATNAVVYLVCRPTLGICALHVNVFDPSGSEQRDNRYWRSLWHLPMPTSLKSFTMPDVGLTFETLEPLTSYQLAYAHEPEVRFDVTWTACVPPRMSTEAHIDQFGRVTGWLEVGGERMDVDCLQMRDRSWTHRSDLDQRVGGYSYALASARHALLMTSAGPDDVKPAAGGWLLRDGKLVDIATGTRTVLERQPTGEPTRVVLEGSDAEGRAFRALGEVVARSWMYVSGNILAPDSLVRWTLDDLECWGEDQDVWSPQAYRARRAALSRSASSAGRE